MSENIQNEETDLLDVVRCQRQEIYAHVKNVEALNEMLEKRNSEIKELRAALDGCDVAGPELMAENEKLRKERDGLVRWNTGAHKAFEAILAFQDCSYGPAWNMQKIARAELLREVNP